MFRQHRPYRTAVCLHLPDSENSRENVKPRLPYLGNLTRRLSHLAMLPDTQCFGPLDLSLNTRDDIAKAYSYSAIMLELASASVPPCVRDFVVKQSYLPRQRFRTPCLASIASISCIYDLLCFQSLFIFLSLTHCNKTLVYRSFPFLH